MRQLIINADDFGLSRDIVDGIVKAASAGRITSTSLLVVGEAFDYATGRLDEISALGKGVHLAFTEGRPVLPSREVPSLVNPTTGSFWDENEYRRQPQMINSQELEREFRAQMQRVMALGIKPTHLDNHCPGIFLRPDLFAAVINIAQHFNLPVRLPFDDAFVTHPEKMAQLSGFPLDLVTKVGGIIRKMTLDAKVRCPNFFRLDFTSGARTSQNLATIIKNLGPGLTEICTHPGNATERGMAELTALLSDEVKLALSAGVVLADYSILSSDGRAVS